jgi:dihydrofolate reductase
MAKIAFVVAVADNGIIGRDGQLPWRLSSDLKMFRRLTMGKPIIMGRRTWESLPKRPLDGRDNIVITRDTTFSAEDAHVAGSVDAALALAEQLAKTRNADEIAVIGGAQVYRAMLDRVDRIYWTQVHGVPEGDTIFPQPDPQAWREVMSEPIAQTERDQYAATLKILERF